MSVGSSQLRCVMSVFVDLGGPELLNITTSPGKELLASSSFYMVNKKTVLLNVRATHLESLTATASAQSSEGSRELMTRALTAAASFTTAAPLMDGGHAVQVHSKEQGTLVPIPYANQDEGVLLANGQDDFWCAGGAQKYLRNVQPTIVAGALEVTVLKGVANSSDADLTFVKCVFALAPKIVAVIPDGFRLWNERWQQVDKAERARPVPAPAAQDNQDKAVQQQAAEAAATAGCFYVTTVAGDEGLLSALSGSRLGTWFVNEPSMLDEHVVLDGPSSFAEISAKAAAFCARHSQGEINAGSLAAGDVPSVDMRVALQEGEPSQKKKRVERR